MTKFADETGLSRFLSKIKDWVNAKVATSTDYGMVKLNPNESVTLNSNGQLEVGGRLGQDPNTTGIYSPKDIVPRGVADFSMMVTEAHGLDFATTKSMGIVTGANITLKTTAAAGATTYQVANNYANRLVCAALVDGYVALNEAWAKENQVVKVASVTINGSSFTPSSSADDSSVNIVITTEESANPDSSTSTIRGYGAFAGYSNFAIGQNVNIGGGGTGASGVIGASCTTKGNWSLVAGNGNYNDQSRNAVLGTNNISRKQNCLLAGQGHDNTNGGNAMAAVGKFSSIGSTTAFAVGNGTSHTARSNALHVDSSGNLVTGGTITDGQGNVLGGGGGGGQSTFYGTSNTAAATAAKVVTCDGFTLTKGNIIAVLFTTANTAATPTLNVNSTGAKSICVGTAKPNVSTNALKWSANTVLYFVYDGAYYRYLGSMAAGAVQQPNGAGAWFGTSSAAAATAAKAVTCANFRMTPGAFIAVTFSTASTAAAPTLNVNSTGTLAIWKGNAATSATNPLTWAAGDTLYFVYDGTRYRYLGTDAGGGGEYTLLPATATTLGGVKVGSGLSVASDGTLSASGGGVTVDGLSDALELGDENVDVAASAYGYGNVVTVDVVISVLNGGESDISLGSMQIAPVTDLGVHCVMMIPFSSSPAALINFRNTGAVDITTTDGAEFATGNAYQCSATFVYEYL